MGLYYTIWPDKSVSIVQGTSKEDAQFVLDELAYAELKDIHVLPAKTGLIVTLAPVVVKTPEDPDGEYVAVKLDTYGTGMSEGLESFILDLVDEGKLSTRTEEEHANR